MKQLFFSLTLASVFFSCTNNKEVKSGIELAMAPTSLSGKVLAETHCARCHALVEPSALHKASWRDDVLPSMGHRMGIFKGDHQPDSLFARGLAGDIVRKANIYPEQPILAREDWDKIVAYYVENAPETIPTPIRDQKISNKLKHFVYREVAYSHRPAMTSMVKILPDQRGIVFSDGKRGQSILTFLSPTLEKNHELFFNRTPIDFHERNDTLFLAIAGDGVFPSDLPAGSLQKISKTDKSGMYNTATEIISGMQRPVQLAYADLNNDGLEDIVACEYGDLTGNLVWFENKGRDRYVKKVLRAKPGAITAIVKDVNQDGHPDIVVLMAQGDEGVFLYTNKGNGEFNEKKLLSFSPLNGSMYIDLADFNGDGFDDLLYVSGDNADRTPYLKNYHGLYIFENDGSFNFKQSWFCQLNGAYKAIARDYDLDGDLDIAAISYFPDYVRYPEESFVYLENKGELKFEGHSFPEASHGRWFVMDAGDLDGDGDIDLALGSFVYFEPMGDTTGLGNRWLKQGPSVVILENTIR